MFRAGVAPARLRAVRLVALVTSAAVLSITAVASPARAATGLEAAVGPVSPAAKVLLPTDPKLWGTYVLGATPNLCKNASYDCVDQTITGMYRRYNPLAARCHHSAVFSLLYLRVTEEYRRFAKAGNLNNPDGPNGVNKQDTDFARLYTMVYDLWYANKPATIPPIWRLALAAADERLVSGSGDALLGMVAHIQRDLPFALWRIHMGDPADHRKINEMLKRAYPTASQELHRRFDPSIAPGGTVPITGELVVEAVATWREQAWRDAQALMAARTSAQFNEVSMRIERAAWDYGLRLYLSTRYVVGAEKAANDSRDAYCFGRQAAA